MMKYVCDRCGKDIPNGNPFVVVYGLLGGAVGTKESSDLCGDCYNECVDFIKDSNAKPCVREVVEAIPHKPIDVDDDYTWQCGNCNGELFCGSTMRDQYCPNCGTKVAWKKVGIDAE